MADKRKAQSPFKDRQGGLGGLGGLVTSPFAGDDLLMMAAANAGPQMQSYEPSWRERLGNLVFDYTGGMGGLGGIPNRMRNEAMIGMDFIPGVGEALGIDDTARALSSGNWLDGALAGGATLAGIVPVGGDLAGAAAKRGIRAYHGSPHDFDRFDLSKIGSGEGAQAYGHGLYFAENEGVARAYRDQLSGEPTIDGKPIWEGLPFMGRMERDEAQRALKRAIASGLEGDEALTAAMKELNELGHAATGGQHIIYYTAANNLFPLMGKKWDQVPGAMYEVQIKADPSTFLDWDKPLKEQSPIVRDAVHRVGRDPAGHGVDRVSDDMRAVELKNLLHNPQGTQRLREHGVSGVKYLDQGSRNAGDGSRNYVVFDDSLIEIVRKYGLAAAIGAGVITEEMGRQMQAQGDI